MASGIPPLLPASPPPLCKHDYNEDEVDTDDSANDDNDEFCDFPVATPANNLTNPPNDMNVSCVIDPISSIELSSCKPVLPNSSLQEIQNSDDESVTAQSHCEVNVDGVKTAADDDSVINSFVTIAMPSVADPSFHSFPPESTYLSSDGENTVIDNAKIDLTFENEITPTENNFTIYSPSLSDSDSIDVPDDSYIICGETNSISASDFLTTFQNVKKKTYPLSREFEKSNDNETCCSQMESHEVEGSTTNVESIDSTVLDENLELQNSDSFFQPFAGVSMTLPSEQVSRLEFNYVFQPEINGSSHDSLSNSINTSRNDTQAEETASVKFSCEFDDDFSDFVSPTTFASSKITEKSTCDSTKVQSGACDKRSISYFVTNELLSNKKCLYIQDQTLKMSEELNWTEIFCPPEDLIEVNVNTIEGKLKCSSVWCKIKDIENCPALRFSWNDSDTNKLLLATLCVDSRNILLGPRWSSEVPRFASNLGFTPLVPQKAAEKSPQNEFPDLTSDIDVENVARLPEINPAMPSVPDAHFDWNNSGLTNPLDSYSHSSLLDLDLLASFDIHSPYYRKKYLLALQLERSPLGGKSSKRNIDGNAKPKENVVAENYELQNSLSMLNVSQTKIQSAEASQILNSLPDLVVMQKQYIVFPIR